MSDALERMKRWDAVVGVDDAVARAVAEERAAVVKWLRSQGVIEGSSPDERNMARWLARCIERGEHRSEVKP